MFCGLSFLSSPAQTASDGQLESRWGNRPPPLERQRVRHTLLRGATRSIFLVSFSFILQHSATVTLIHVMRNTSILQYKGFFLGGFHKYFSWGSREKTHFEDHRSSVALLYTGLHWLLLWEILSLHPPSTQPIFPQESTTGPFLLFVSVLKQLELHLFAYRLIRLFRKFSFCLRRSPNKRTLDVVLLLIAVGTTFTFNFFFKDIEIFIKKLCNFLHLCDQYFFQKRPNTILTISNFFLFLSISTYQMTS